MHASEGIVSFFMCPHTGHVMMEFSKTVITTAPALHRTGGRSGRGIQRADRSLLRVNYAGIGHLQIVAAYETAAVLFRRFEHGDADQVPALEKCGPV